MDSGPAPFTSVDGEAVLGLEGVDDEDELVVLADSDPVALALGCIVIVVLVVAGLSVALARQDWYRPAFVSVLSRVEPRVRWDIQGI